ncbi:MAG TPA: serine/threonine-protein kinase [Anaeromyxobacteraceae bacterium]|jgi:serine/threonine-protein kinase
MGSVEEDLRLSQLDVDPATWAVLSRLLDEALDRPPGEVERWLESLAPEHREHAPRLRELLAHRTSAGAPSPLRTLPRLEPGVGPEEEAAEAPGGPGRAVGPYRLRRLLAEGGMGAVWLAERADGMVQRPVALKLPHRSWAASGLAERMAREREILASLNHPNIARLYDAGVSPDGQPWLALEYVEGRPIDAFARDRGLDLRARLGLFLQVAGAVAHAHAQLVVHRDLKPGNVLVTAEGQVRLLDFGIAKLLGEGGAHETELTRLGGRPLTPRYASPEQIGGAPCGVASDVYSLGVLLFEMLSGASPYPLERETAAALEEAILKAEPARPSELAAEPSLRRALRGDLDAVISRALKKRPEERYPTADAFAGDVERWLEGRPVEARPDSPGYRLGKLVRRHRLAAGAVAAAAVATLGGAGFAAWQARVALAEKRTAEEVKDFVVSILRDADPYVSGKIPSATTLLRQARERADRGLRPEVRVEILGILGSSLARLQDLEAAEGALGEAAEVARRELGRGHPAALRARVRLAEVHRLRDQTGELRRDLEETLPLLRGRGGAQAEDLFEALLCACDLAMTEGRKDDAVSLAEEGVALAVERWGERSWRTAQATYSLAGAHLSADRPGPGAAAAERALRIARELDAGDRKHPFTIQARRVHATALGRLGEHRQALALLEEVVRDAREVFGQRSTVVAYALPHLTLQQLATGRVESALESSAEVVSIGASKLAPGSVAMANFHQVRARALLAARRAGEALEALREVPETYRRFRGAASARTLGALRYRALALAYLGRRGEARQVLPLAVGAEGREGAALEVEGTVRRLVGDAPAALALHRAALASAPEGAGFRRMRLLMEVGLDELDLGQQPAAAAALEESLVLRRRLEVELAPEVADALLGLGRARLGLGRPEEALRPLEEADAFWRGFDGESRWAGEAALWLGRCRAALGQRTESRRALARAERLLSRAAGRASGGAAGAPPPAGD